ncbi:MAG: hypothetical protein ACE5K0_08605 [Candidatus Methanofastidiosia archaeon]
MEGKFSYKDFEKAIDSLRRGIELSISEKKMRSYISKVDELLNRCYLEKNITKTEYHSLKSQLKNLMRKIKIKVKSKKRCLKCGYENARDALFCMGCANPFEQNLNIEIFEES